VGRLLPAVNYQLEPVDGITEGGKLHVQGPNIMLGYLLAEQAGTLIPTASRYGAGWYDTGDIVAVDAEGFITIKGRSKRFAKIGGEMVSLTLVEQLMAQVWPEAQHAAVSVSDAKKGEQIIVLTTQENATISTLNAGITGVAAIMLPKKIITVAALPVMATGKTNYPAVSEQVAALLAV
jgi:acyl-[acyl-carrier-protein]-phospholipid O-acyltransferase/long-chain-fatty-acid--[acyl-carrier-protein] ligase